jgi:universal stress protein A
MGWPPLPWNDPTTASKQKEVRVMVPKKILFCTDFSENSEPARELAVDYAKAFGDELDQILKRTQDSATSRLESLAKECGQLVQGVRTYCRVGLPPSEIVSLATEESADLIVVGTHGLTGVKHLVMGSIARSVLKTAHRPVLIVEAPAGAGESSEKR